MSLHSTLRHNQATFATILISIILAAGFFGCHLLKQPAGDAAGRAADAADAIAPLVPPPYKEILIGISALLSSGLFVDNRRKDTVIKVLKSQHDHKDGPYPKPPGALRDNPSG